MMVGLLIGVCGSPQQLVAGLRGPIPALVGFWQASFQDLQEARKVFFVHLLPWHGTLGNASEAASGLDQKATKQRVKKFQWKHWNKQQNMWQMMGDVLRHSDEQK